MTTRRNQPKPKVFNKVLKSRSNKPKNIFQYSSRRYKPMGFLSALVFIVVFSAVGVKLYQVSNAASAVPVIRSALTSNDGSHYCLNNQGDSYGAANPANTILCGSDASDQWRVSGSKIMFGSTHCLAVQNGGQTSGDNVVMDTCNGHAGQQWTSKDGGYENPNSGLCLNVPGSNLNAQLIIYACSNVANENWTPGTFTPSTPSCGSGNKASTTTAQCIAKALLADRGWSSQYSCLNNIYVRESGWRWNADNSASGAYGIPQSLPGDKMASAGSDWQTNAATQIKWGLGYIESRYGNPCNAWAFWQAHGWYGVYQPANGPVEHF